VAENQEVNCKSTGVKEKYGHWWPLLLGPLAMVLVYVAEMTGHQWFVGRGTNENIALVLLSVSVVGFLVQAIIYRSEFLCFMLALCGAFFCREWHFPGTSKGIYVCLAVLGFWAFKRSEKFKVFMDNKRLSIWIWSTFGTYLLSQLIARRVFRDLYLPLEEELHISLEESVETMAHLMMIATCFIIWNFFRQTARRH
jgi:hypothetical protein